MVGSSFPSLRSSWLENSLRHLATLSIWAAITRTSPSASLHSANLKKKRDRNKGQREKEKGRRDSVCVCVKERDRQSKIGKKRKKTHHT